MIIANSKPVGTHAHLLIAFLTGYIQYTLISAFQGNLEHECRFSNSGLSTNQCKRTWNKASSQHTV
jgi:hypothetical protein